MSHTDLKEIRTTVPIARIVWSSVLGTAIEWYDFIAYGTASALVFGKLFFPNLSPTLGVIAALGSYGVGFLARPLGAAIFGHLGDRLGRKSVLSMTIIMTGAGTVLIGCLPNYSQIGIVAPLLLVCLRLLQGIGLGGERGGAVLMVIENVPDGHRGVYGALVQLGYPLGQVLSMAAFAGVSRLPEPALLAWGWRIPFLASVLLVGIGIFIRRRLGETRVFSSVQAMRTLSETPVLDAMTQWRSVLRVFGLTVSEISLSFVATVFSISYVINHLNLQRSVVVNSALAASLLQLVAIPFFGGLSDRWGRKPLYLAGAAFALMLAFPFFWLLDTRNPVWIGSAIVLALSVGQAAMYSIEATWAAELFAPKMRYSGASLGLQVGAALTGGFTPIVATSLYAWSGSTYPISIFLAVLAIASLFAALRSPETIGRPFS